MEWLLIVVLLAICVMCLRVTYSQYREIDRLEILLGIERQNRLKAEGCLENLAAGLELDRVLGAR